MRGKEREERRRRTARGGWRDFSSSRLGPSNGKGILPLGSLLGVSDVPVWMFVR